MGFRSIESLVIILFIVLVIFGAKRLRELGGDLGAAVRNFRKGLHDENNQDKTP